MYLMHCKFCVVLIADDDTNMSISLPIVTDHRLNMISNIEVCTGVYGGVGVIQQGMTVGASLMTNGNIQTSDGRIFTTVVAWCKSVLGVTAMRLETACRQVNTTSCCWSLCCMM